MLHNGNHSLSAVGVIRPRGGCRVRQRTEADMNEAASTADAFGVYR